MTVLDRVLGDPGFAERYELGERLGTGGMGEVFRGVHRALKRPVAVKLLAADLLRDPAYRERFTAEAQLASGLIHSNVVAVFDFGIVSGEIPYLVTELVEGEPLSQILERKPLLPEQVLEIAIQVCEGLSAIHGLGIVHRDIKPENLLVSLGPPIKVKIADFGIAKGSGGATGPKTATGMMMGTPAYMAPEQVLGDPLGPATDLYAFTLLLYVMIVGEHPFMAETAMEVVTKQVHQQAPIPADLHKGLREVLAKGLEKRTADRYQAAAEMKAQLMQLAVALHGSGTFRRELAVGAAQMGPDSRGTKLTDTSGVNRKLPGDLSGTKMRLSPPSRAGVGPAPAPSKPGVPLYVVGAPPPPRRSGGLATALAAAALAGALAFATRTAWKPSPQPSFVEPPPPTRTASAAPASSWVDRVRRKLASPEGGPMLFRNVLALKGLGRASFTDAPAVEVDAILLEALDAVPVEASAVAGPEPESARLFRELSATLRGKLGEDTADKYGAALARLRASKTDAGEPLLHKGNVLERLHQALKLTRAASDDEVIDGTVYMLTAARHGVPLGGWCALFAEAVSAAAWSSGSLLGLAGRRADAARESKDRPNLETVLPWIEKALREVGTRRATDNDAICRWRRKLLQADVIARMEAAGRKRSNETPWAVPESVSVERLADIERLAPELREDIEKELSGGTLDRDLRIEQKHLTALARALECPPALMERVEKDQLEVCVP